MKIPKMLIIEVTNRCNLRCKGCPTWEGKTCFPLGDIDFGFFKTIIDRAKVEMPDVAVLPWMLGEPLLHPQYLEMCKYTSAAGMKFYVTTNLTIWDEEVFRFLLSPESTCYQIIVSMDGLPGSGNIAKARPGTDEETLLDNIGRLIELKHSMNSGCDIAVKICERGQDHEEIEEYIKRWIDKVDYVAVGRMLDQENDVSMRHYPCLEFDSQFMFIRWDGTLILCDYNLHAANEFVGSYGVLGQTESLIGVYNGPELTARREAQNRGEYLAPCDKCGIAYTGAGIRGKVVFRADPDKREVFFKQDYYNTFYSMVEKGKPDEYYLRGK